MFNYDHRHYPVVIIDSIALVSMREQMDRVPSEKDDPIFFAMKRIQQSVWLLKNSFQKQGSWMSYKMFEIFKHLITNKKAKANAAALAAAPGCTDPDTIDTISEMNKALEMGLRCMWGQDRKTKIDLMWSSLWELTNNGNPDWGYPTEVIIRTPHEYEEWIARVLILVEEAFK